MTSVRPWSRLKLIPVDLYVACVLTGPWTVLLMEGPKRNDGVTDTAVFASYVAGYFAFWLGVLWGARLFAVLTSSPTPPRERVLLFELVLGTLVSILFAGLLGFYLPPHGPTVTFVSATIAGASICFLIARRVMTASRFEQCGVLTPFRIRLGACLALFFATTFFAADRYTWSRSVSSPERLELGNQPYRVCPVTRLTIVGVDGLDWETLNTLVNNGSLPNMRELMRRGASGPVRTFSAHSPLIWTSIATGVSSESHGIDRYVSPYLRGTEVLLPGSRFDFLGKSAARLTSYREWRPVSSNDRLVPALWDLLTLAQRRSLVVNWWASYPAGFVDGILVSDYAIPGDSLSDKEIPKLARFQRLIWPPEENVTLRRVLRRSLAGRAASLSEDPTASVAAKSEFFILRDTLAFDLYKEYARGRFDLKMLYLNEVDALSHAYSLEVFGPNEDNLRPPRVSPDRASALWKELVVDSYARLDARLAELVSALAGGESLIVVSDHGWRYDGTSHWRLPDGVVMLFGPPFKVDYRLQGACPYDVFPTAAFLLGLPLSRELEGQVLSSALQEGPHGLRKPTFVASYGKRIGRIRADGSELDQSQLERLRALGYVN